MEFALITIGVISTYLLVCYLAALFSISPPRRVPKTPVLNSLVKVEDSLIETDAGLCPIWQSSNVESANVIYICASGYLESRLAWQPLFKEMPFREDFGLSFAVIAPAMPGRDASPERRIGFGPREARVLVAAGKYAKLKNQNAKLILVGVSLGASAAWLASEAEESLFDGIVAEAAFPTLQRGICHYLTALIYYPFYPIVWFGQKVNQVQIQSVRPIDAAKNWCGKPGLIIHDGRDFHFPLSFAEEFAEASNCPIWVIEGAYHAFGLSHNRQNYITKVIEVGYQAFHFVKSQSEE